MLKVYNVKVYTVSSSLSSVWSQFMYTLAICLFLELLGGVLALVFHNQVS